MAPVRAIRSAKAASAVEKEANVDAKVRTKVIMDRKSQGEMGIVSIGVVEVIGAAKSMRIEGTGGSDDAGSGLVAVGIIDVGM